MTRLVRVFNRVTLLFLSTLEQIISQTTLFLAAKVEEQPRKLEHVIKIAHAFINPQEPVLDTKSSVSKPIDFHRGSDFNPILTTWSGDQLDSNS